MRYKSREAKLKEQKNVWQKRFAWFPKEIGDDVVWLEYYEYRIVGWYQHGGVPERTLQVENRTISHRESND